MQLGLAPLPNPVLTARLTCRESYRYRPPSGRSSGVEHNLAKVGVEGSNPFARSRFPGIFEISVSKNSYFMHDRIIDGFPIFQERILTAAAPRIGREALESKTFRDGSIYLYRRPDYKKPTWLCRLKIPNMSGYVVRSTRTTDEHAAYKFADDLYNQFLVRSLKGEDLNSPSIAKAIESYVTRLESSAARQSIHYKILLVKRAKPFFETKTFAELGTALISRLIDYLVKGSRKSSLSPNTIRRTYSDFKHFLNWCVEEGYLSAIPRFPKVLSEQSQRPHFDSKDWTKLTRQLREFVKVENRAVKRSRVMLRDYVLVLANTGIRVGEARTLKWRDVRSVGGSDERPADIVLTVDGKTGVREVVSRSWDIKKSFKRLYELRIEELTSPANPNPQIDPDSLIFCHRDGTEVGSFKKSFRTLLQKAGVETDSRGRVRTIYSLRHTYATNSLQHSVNHYALAKNMDTSVAMLENFYGHTSNVASADELTKRTKRKISGASSSFSWLD
jgi:integrase